MTNSNRLSRSRRLCNRLLQGSALVGLATAWAHGAVAQTVADASATQVETVVVTGTSIRGAAPVGDNVITVDRDVIEATGANSVENCSRPFPP